MTGADQKAFTRLDDQGVLVLTLDVPGEKVNTLGRGMIGEFEAILDEVAKDDAVKAVVIQSGKPDNFIAGADIKEFGQPPREPWLPDLFNEIEASSKPVIAAIHGTALGGGLELCLASHYRCAVATAKVGLPEVKLGLLPGAGGTQRTPRLTDITAALELITSGNPISATSAETLGLVDRIIDGDLREGALAYAQELIDRPASIRAGSVRQREVDLHPLSREAQTRGGAFDRL